MGNTALLRRFRPRALLTFALFLAAAYAGVLAVRYAGGYSKQLLVNEGLVIHEAELDFGERWYSEKLDITLTLRNATDHPIHVKDLAVSCSCLRLEPRQLTISAGAAEFVTAHLDLSAATCQDTSDEIQEAIIRIHPLVAGASPRQRGWTLHGRVRPALVANSNLVDFGDEAVRGKTIAQKEVLLTAKTALKDFRVRCANPSLLVSLAKFDADWIDVRVLRVAIRKDAPYGAIDSELLITARADEDKQITKVIRVRGEVAGEVRAVPPKLFLGSGTIGGTLNASITLRSVLDRGFEILGFQDMPAGLCARAARQSSKHTQVIDISQQVLRDGSQNLRFTILVRTADGRDDTATAAISYYGVRPSSEAKGDS